MFLLASPSILLSLLQLQLLISHFRKCLHNNGQKQIQHKVRPYQDKQREEYTWEGAHRIHVIVHYLRPAFKSYYSEYLDQAHTKIVKGNEPIIYNLEVCYIFWI